MPNQVSNFQFQSNALRVIAVNGEPWFLAADVCRAIGIKNPTNAVKILDDDEVALKTFKGLTNGNEEANFISESGMYKIVMRSQDAIKRGTPAHSFTKWVTSEVLPAIRKTGSYSLTISKVQQGELATLIIPNMVLAISDAMQHTVIGFSSSDLQRRTPAIRAVFLCPMHGGSFMGKPCGRAKALPGSFVTGLLTRMASPTRLAAGSEFKTLQRRHIMSNQSIAVSTAPETFNFEKFPVRAINRNGDIWFVAADVCAVLNIKNTSQALETLDDDERSMLNIGRSTINGGGGVANIINESGLYALILRSRKAEAKRFRKWVTSEVLPAIRKTGSYSMSPEPNLLNKDEYARVQDIARKYFADFRAGMEPALDIPDDVLAGIVAKQLSLSRFVLTFTDGAVSVRTLPDDAFIIRLQSIPDVVGDPYYPFTPEALIGIINAAAMRLSKASAPAPAIAQPQKPESPRKQWKNIRLVERMLKSMRIKQEHMYGTTIVSPREVERLHRMGIIGERQIVRLRKEMV